MERSPRARHVVRAVKGARPRVHLTHSLTTTLFDGCRFQWTGRRAIPPRQLMFLSPVCPSGLLHVTHEA